MKTKVRIKGTNISGFLTGNVLRGRKEILTCTNDYLFKAEDQLEYLLPNEELLLSGKRQIEASLYPENRYINYKIVTQYMPITTWLDTHGGHPDPFKNRKVFREV